MPALCSFGPYYTLYGSSGNIHTIYNEMSVVCICRASYIAVVYTFARAARHCHGALKIIAVYFIFELSLSTLESTTYLKKHLHKSHIDLTMFNVSVPNISRSHKSFNNNNHHRRRRPTKKLICNCQV